METKHTYTTTCGFCGGAVETTYIQNELVGFIKMGIWTGEGAPKSTHPTCTFKSMNFSAAHQQAMACGWTRDPGRGWLLCVRLGSIY